MNQTNFLIGQAVCESGEVQQSVIFQFYGGIFCNDSSTDTTDVLLRTLYQIDPYLEISDMNIGWDHTCNVIVLQPEYTPDYLTLHTYQVSEYDSAVRPSPDYLTEPTGSCGDCWQKVPGLGAMDAGLYRPSGNVYWNCGDSCIFYTLEEHIINGNPIMPRALIGRYYRTGALAVNITDSLQIQTLSWSPYNTYPQNQFIGLGICCTQRWCHPDCEFISGHTVLFSYDSNKQLFTVLSDVSDVLDQDTFRMGVEFSFSYILDPLKQAYVYHQNTVLTFDLTVANNGYITAANQIRQSPPINQKLVMWFPEIY